MNYTVVAARHKKTIDGAHGPLQIIALQLHDGNPEFPIDAEWATLPTTSVPTPGQVLDGNLEDSQYGKKFKRTPANQGGGGGGFGPRPEDPARSRRILRQHSQTTALSTLDLMERWGLLGEAKPTDRASFFALLTTLMDWFDKDADAKGPTVGP